MLQLIVSLFLFLSLSLPLICRTESTLTHTYSSCNRTCGESKVRYPFGFSPSCPIPLSCNSSSTVLLSGYPIENFTSSSLIVTVAADCNRSVESMSGLFGPNHAMTWQNGLFLLNCTAPRSSLSQCLLPTDLISQMSHYNYSNCGKKGDNITCLSNSSAITLGFLSKDMVLNNGCRKLFMSVMYEAEPADQPVLLFGAAEVGWWVNGTCRCDAHANCTRVEGKNGYQCACREGFVGDGFADGDGCVKDTTKCNAINKKSGASCEHHDKVGIIIGGIAGVLVVISIAIICIICCRRRSKSSEDYQITTKRLLSEASCTVPLYSYREMGRATNSFSDTHKLGTGAYGTVYVGKLPNQKSNTDDLVAIKRIRYRADPDSINQVTNEIKLISSVSHPNLVRLLGCCVDRGEQILVYEFMPNGTLDQHLRPDHPCRRSLPWPLRLSIATETAEALSYLHSSIHPPIYHRDVKSSNILLDRNFTAKVADFGLSRTGRTELSHISTAPQGTPGYLDPEYHQNFHLSDKSDVYSFGVVLVEIVTAMKVVDFSRPPSEVNLASLAVDRIGRGQIEEIVDPSLLGSGSGDDGWVMDSIKKVAELAFRCLAYHKDVRPCMTEVAGELERIRASGPSPLGKEEEMSENVELGSLLSLQKMVMGRTNRGRRGLTVDSPVSVQEVWVSEQSSPSTNGSMPRFAA